ncbi:N-formylglutamate amidohydrolase [Aestuariirhabdus litorea]|uniref:N-formylglutamate amidohydrolase n=2 Tax=Aestuariirhabdus litorea TaxID=2528527 RepID=A0A3P3VN19_9GAMM|nr:N-formylglutamate amidohydrolase [Aestuariirhabdus litorea]RWW98629.1 N-formylglutamate amidohydrolase [Endozoicomonadaceae bacterium GTF-13]
MPQWVHKAVETINPEGSSHFLLVCEHASNRIPPALDRLGLSPEQIESHIAWDPGALEVARRLSSSLDAPLVAACVSRLVYDCNRPPESPDAVCTLSENDPIPGNLNLTPAQHQARVEQVYEPFRQTLANLLANRVTRQQPTLLVTLHSFVPVYKGVPREVEIGILHDSDSRLADLMLEAPLNSPPRVVRRNEPYGPADGVTHTLKEHALPLGLPNVMIEIRNDLLQQSAGQQQIADLLQQQLQRAARSLLSDHPTPPPTE